MIINYDYYTIIALGLFYIQTFYIAKKQLDFLLEVSKQSAHCTLRWLPIDQKVYVI